MIKKLNAILLAFLLVLPTFGVAIEKHCCRGRLADVALFTEADTMLKGAMIAAKKKM